MSGAVRAATSPMFDLATHYAATRCWPVFPCSPTDKSPLTSRGFKDASLKSDYIKSRWSQFPKAMIGIPTGKPSGVWVLDIDTKEGKDGFAALAILEAENGPLPATLTCRTPSGGKHYYFTHDDALRISSSDSGIDVRGEGGYVIAPGSVKDDGLYYEWHEETVPVVAAPAWLIALLSKPAVEKVKARTVNKPGSNKPYVDSAVKMEIAKLTSTTTGRNAQLNDSAYALGTLVGPDLSAGEASDLLFGAAVDNGYVQKDGASAARKTINSGLEAGMANPREIPESSGNQWLPPSDGEWVAANDNCKATDQSLPKMHPCPFASGSAGGILGAMSDWITSTAIVPVPELSLAASIALLGGLFGDRALGPTRSGVNTFVTTVMGVASGKGHAPKSILKLAGFAAKPGAVTNGDPTSYAAIERMLRKNKSTAIVMDEFGITLQDVNSAKNSAATSIRKFLLAIYDQADSTFHGRQYASEASKTDNEPILGPALTVLGMTTAHTLYKGLSEDSLSEGFISRFIFVEGTHPDVIRAPGLSRVEKTPDDLIAALRNAVTEFPRAAGNLDGAFTKHVVPFDGGETGEGYKRWTEVFDWQHRSDWTPRQRDINGRAAENTLRLATIRAISRNPSDPAVVVGDIEWGWAIVHRSIEVITEGANRHMAGSAPEAMRKAILEALRAAKGRTLPWSQLLQRDGIGTKGGVKEVSEAMSWLIQSGEVTSTHEGSKPGPRQSFTIKS